MLAAAGASSRAVGEPSEPLGGGGLVSGGAAA